MSKKVNRNRKKNSKKNRGYDKKKSRKKLDKKLGSRYKFAKLKGSVDKDDVKALNSLLKKQTRMKALEKVRQVCNHHKRSNPAYMTVAAFKAEYPERMHLVPMLEESIRHFGEVNIGVCPIDLTPVLNNDCMNQTELEKSATYLYLVSNTLKGLVKLDKKKGMPLIYKLQISILDNFMFLRKKLAKILPAETQESNSSFVINSAAVGNATKASETAAARRSTVVQE